MNLKIAGALLFALLAGCSVPPPNIVGTWQALNPKPGSSLTIEFKKDATYTWHERKPGNTKGSYTDEDMAGTYKADNTKIRFIPTESTVSRTENGKTTKISISAHPIDYSALLNGAYLRIGSALRDGGEPVNLHRS